MAYNFSHRCKKNVFYIIYYTYKKRVFNVFYFLNAFHFLMATLFNPTKHAKLLHKRLLSDGFIMGAIGNDLNKSYK